MQTIRDKIVNEILNRLRYKFGADSRIYAGDGGVWGSWGRELPCFHYYELADTRKLIGNGLYDIILPIQLEYFVKLTRKAGVFDEGREKLYELQSAIELDERLTSHVFVDNKLIKTDEDLCVVYEMNSCEISEILDNTLGVAVIYQFRYIDRFYGYEQSRH